MNDCPYPAQVITELDLEPEGGRCPVCDHVFLGGELVSEVFDRLEDEAFCCVLCYECSHRDDLYERLARLPRDRDGALSESVTIDRMG